MTAAERYAVAARSLTKADVDLDLDKLEAQALHGRSPSFRARAEGEDGDDGAGSDGSSDAESSDDSSDEGSSDGSNDGDSSDDRSNDDSSDDSSNDDSSDNSSDCERSDDDSDNHSSDSCRDSVGDNNSDHIEKRSGSTFHRDVGDAPALAATVPAAAPVAMEKNKRAVVARAGSAAIAAAAGNTEIESTPHRARARSSALLHLESSSTSTTASAPASAANATANAAAAVATVASRLSMLDLSSGGRRREEGARGGVGDAAPSAAPLGGQTAADGGSHRGGSVEDGEGRISSDGAVRRMIQEL